MSEYKQKQINVGLDLEDVFNYVRNKFRLLDKPLSWVYRGGHAYYPSDIPEQLRKKLTIDYHVKLLDNPKVAVLIPIYNGAKFIDQCFGYLLNQRYDNLEIIVINDGSTDESEELLVKYESIFKNRGFSYKHITQPNSRLAVAMNNALQYVTAEYIMIYEVDDVLYRDGILDKVRFLQCNPGYGMVRNNGYYINSFTECGKRLFVNKNPHQEENHIFERILDGTANNWPASYLIRKDIFWECLGDSHKIYEHPGGCHLQFMMPMAYAAKVGFIDKPLMGYYVHIDSDSHKGGIESAIKRTYQYEQIRSEMVSRIDMHNYEKEEYKRIVNELYNSVRAGYAVKCKDKALFQQSADNLGWSQVKRIWKWMAGTGLLGRVMDFGKRGFGAVIRKHRNLKSNLRYLKLNSKGYLW